VGTETQLLRLPAELHCLYPASRFAVIVHVTVTELSDLVESCLKRARDGPNDRLCDLRGLECVAERQAHSAADDARRHVGHGDGYYHKNDCQSCVGKHRGYRHSS
jgi:hypothetical protein